MAQPRTYALDNLRTYLTILVIIHHAVIPYGGSGSWLYKSPYHKQSSSLPLLSFNATNQTFFMAMFFLLSGYFSSIAAKKRSRKRFLLEKWKRLGVPMLVYSVFSAGLISWDMKWRKGEVGLSKLPEEMWEGVKSCRGVRGPVWYCALLLVLDAVYALIRPGHFGSEGIRLPNQTPTQNQSQEREQDQDQGQGQPQSTPLIQPSAFEISPDNISLSTAPTPPLLSPLSTTPVLAALLLSITTAFALRIPYPAGTTLPLLNLQPGYAPQYILYYTAGLYLQRTSIPLHRALSVRTLLATAFLSTLSIALAVLAVHYARQDGIPFEAIMHLASGGKTLIALSYALWNETTGLLLSALLLTLFHSHKLPFLARRWAVLGRDVGLYSYAAFLVHPVVLVHLQSGVDEGRWRGAVGKGVVVGGSGCVWSWVLGWVVKGLLDRVGGRGSL